MTLQIVTTVLSNDRFGHWLTLCALKIIIYYITTVGVANSCLFRRTATSRLVQGSTGTWRCSESRDHSIRHVPFPVGRPLEPRLNLQPFSRYSSPKLEQQRIAVGLENGGDIGVADILRQCRFVGASLGLMYTHAGPGGSREPPCHCCCSRSSLLSWLNCALYASIVVIRS